MKWYEEGEGTFKNGVFVLSEHDAFVQEWGKKIRDNPQALREFFEKHLIDEKTFDEVMDHQIITAGLFFILLTARH
jgi:hypothetical protein